MAYVAYRYYINGWRYGAQYFLSFRFTRDELNRMADGEIIKKDGNEFWMIKEEDD